MIRVGSSPPAVDLAVEGAHADDAAVLPWNCNYDENGLTPNAPVPDHLQYGIDSADAELRNATLRLTNPYATTVVGEWWIGEIKGTGPVRNPRSSSKRQLFLRRFRRGADLPVGQRRHLLGQRRGIAREKGAGSRSGK